LSIAVPTYFARLRIRDSPEANSLSLLRLKLINPLGLTLAVVGLNRSHHIDLVLEAIWFLVASLGIILALLRLVVGRINHRIEYLPVVVG